MTASPLAAAITAAAAGVGTFHATVIVLDGKARLMLSVDEVCELLGVNRKRVKAWIDSGELPVLNLAPGSRNGHYRIAYSAVLALSARHDEPIPPQ